MPYTAPEIMVPDGPHKRAGWDMSYVRKPGCKAMRAGKAAMHPISATFASEFAPQTFLRRPPGLVHST
jgi:hypothetical protein